MEEKVIFFLQTFDVKLFERINHTMHNSIMDAFMPLITNTGEGGLIWIIIGLALFISRRPGVKKTALLMLVALLASFLAGECIKHIFQRPRPFETLPDVELLVRPPYSFSFPSEHAANAFAAGLVLARKLPGLAWFFIPLACVMAFSRVYVGVHYPADILVGSLLGTACAALILRYEYYVFPVGDKLKPPIG
ncbi:MAG: Undecaprenyl-diphosphatase BcrC [Pelotomaculum sp. PtaU1.Bin035]|nr:MAG: Undecaprenyl-diphosphatase BcrC [Pelotomaculum sp. PtaU1.Bin035]